MIDNKKKDTLENFQMTIGLDLLEFLKERSAKTTKEDALCYLISQVVQEPITVIKNGYSFTLQPGQVMAPLLQLAKEWNWDRKSVRRFLGGLEQLGYIRKFQYQYGTILEFSGLSARTPDIAVPSGPLVKQTSTPVVDELFSIISDGLMKNSGLEFQSVLYEDPPLQLDEETRNLCREVYDKFISNFPLLPKPAPYDQRIEKDIYYVFILGMNGNFGTLQRYFDIIRNDPFRNGAMAQLSPNSGYTESFQSLFSCKWQIALAKESENTENQK